MNEDDFIMCVRADTEMSKAEWLSVPAEIRARYWKETNWGKNSSAVSPELVRVIRRRLKRD